METFFDQVEDVKSRADAPVLRQELSREISDAIQKLPHQQQWIFMLRFNEGLALAEIAAATGLAEGTVKSSLHFAIQKFSKEMGMGGRHGL